MTFRLTPKILVFLSLPAFFLGIFYYLHSPQKTNVSTFEGIAMTVPYRISFVTEQRFHTNADVQEIINSIFNRINTVYNKWNPDSELSKINKAKSGQWLAISQELYRFLQVTQSFVEMTEGKFDPTIEPIQHLWREALENNRLPDEKELAKVSDAIGWDKIELKENAILKKHSATEIDLGGIVKGYTVDLLVEALNKNGLKDILVDWGGEIRASGSHPDGRPWKIYISQLNNTDPEKAMAFIELDSQAIATSGDYLQQWTVDKQTYCHVFDAVSKRPLIASHTSVASVSVMTSSCLTADVLATAAMLLPTKEAAEQWAKKFPEATFWILSRKSIQESSTP